MNVNLLAGGEATGIAADRVIVYDSTGRPLAVIFELAPDAIVVKSVADADFGMYLGLIGLGRAPAVEHFKSATITY